jgi:hypothetical protein
MTFEVRAQATVKFKNENYDFRVAFQTPLRHSQRPLFHRFVSFAFFVCCEKLFVNERKFFGDCFCFDISQ